MTAPAAASLRSALAQRWREDVARSARMRASAALARDIVRWLLDFRRARRRYLFGDLDYDFESGVNTTAGNVGHRARLHAALLGVPYMPTDQAAFAEIMQALAIEHARFTFLDIGSGKGRVLILAAAYPFRRIIGVEIVPELHAAAEENIRRWRANHTHAPEMASVLADARDHELPREPLVVYLFNPLPEPALANWLQRLQRSAAAHPREIYIVYYNKVLEHLFTHSAGLQKLAGTHQWAIYRMIT